MPRAPATRPHPQWYVTPSRGAAGAATRREAAGAPASPPQPSCCADRRSAAAAAAAAAHWPWVGLMPSSMLLPLGRYTTLRDLERVLAMSRAASMRRSSIMPGPACLVASEMRRAASDSPSARMTAALRSCGFGGWGWG